MVNQQATEQLTPTSDLSTPSATLSRARAVVDVEIQALEDLKNQLNDDFFKAIELIETVPGRVVVTGMGKSGLIGKKIAATLSSTGTPAFFLHPAEGSHGDLGVLTSQDVVIAISNSGETPEILNVLPLIKRLGLPLIAMTGKPESTLGKQSDAVLNVAVRQEACPLNLAPTASTTSTLVMGDALAVVLLERKGFTPDDFALVHPAGSLGKRLLVTVNDLMHTGEDLPLISLETPFLEALVEITAKKLGIGIIIDNSQAVQGILTDGDIRRALTKQAEGVDISAIKLKDIMTESPMTITPEELAVSALRKMEEKKITVLLVKSAEDSTNNSLGVIHMHDILKTGIS